MSSLLQAVRHEDQFFPFALQQISGRQLVKISLIFTATPSGHTIMVPYNTISSNNTRCKMEISMVYQPSDIQNHSFTFLLKFQSFTKFDISGVDFKNQHIWGRLETDRLHHCKKTLRTSFMCFMLQRPQPMTS